MDELIEAVQRQAGISSEQATLAVSVMLGYLTARLPSPLVGRIKILLDRGEGRNQTEDKE